MRQKPQSIIIPDDIPPPKFMRVEEQQILTIEDLFNQIAIADTEDRKKELIKEGMTRIKLLKDLAIMDEEELARYKPSPAIEPLVITPASTDPLANISPPETVTLAVTVNLLNYENIRLEVTAKNIDSCLFAITHALNKLGPSHEPTRELITHYINRVIQ